MQLEINVNLCGTGYGNDKNYLSEDNLNIYYPALFAIFLQKKLHESSLNLYSNKKSSLPKPFSSNVLDVIQIKNKKNGKYVLIDFRDSPCLSLQLLELDKKCVHVYASMYNQGLSEITNHELKRKYSPFFFFDQQPNLTKFHREEIQKIRKNKSNLIPKMAFHGSIGDESEKSSGFNYVDFNFSPFRPVRQIVREVKKKRPDLIDVFDADSKLSKIDWWYSTSNYILTLTVPGHPWCFREHECWGLGIATISNRYTAPLPYPLLADKHYVDCNTSGKTPMDVELDLDKSSDLIIKKFLETRDDYSFIREVEFNSMHRYDNFSSVESSVNLLYEHLFEFLRD